MACLIDIFFVEIAVLNARELQQAVVGAGFDEPQVAEGGWLEAGSVSGSAAGISLTVWVRAWKETRAQQYRRPAASKTTKYGSAVAEPEVVELKRIR